MNSVIDAIKKRRSVRAYEPAPVSRESLDLIIEAGNEAPSAMNSQPWRFVVVQDPAAKKKLLRAALPNAKKILDLVKDSDPERHAAIMKRLEEQEDPVYYSAPAVIFVIGSGRYAEHSCPLGCENMMLAAHSLGLGSCWVGFGSMVADEPEIASLLDLQPQEKIYGPILIGRPKGYPDRPPKKTPVTKWV
ncbi:MAG: nitroreductase family protein [Nitrospirae bacterium]|nr:MAG: nitroreductase family protein [Nitrospirota bacterium]